MGQQPLPTGIPLACLVSGCWKYLTAQDWWRNKIRYSLIVSIDVPDEMIDIYSAVEDVIETKVGVEGQEY